MRNLLLAALALAGCGTDADSVCLEYVDHIASAYERCEPGTYQEAFAALSKNTGNCSGFKSVRDEAALRGACFSFLATVPCATLMGPASALEKAEPAACLDQLLY